MQVSTVIRQKARKGVSLKTVFHPSLACPVVSSRVVLRCGLVSLMKATTIKKYSRLARAAQKKRTK